MRRPGSEGRADASPGRRTVGRSARRRQRCGRATKWRRSCWASSPHRSSTTMPASCTCAAPPAAWPISRRCPPIRPRLALRSAPDTCTPVVRGNPQTMTLFDAWANVPDHGRNGINGSARPTEGRAAVVRGEALFNRLNCPGCHATNNVGNNPSKTLLIRLGVDSPDTLAGLAAAGTRVDRLLERVRMLPEYCLRPAGSTSDSPCGDEVGDATTTDPGRALVTGRHRRRRQVQAADPPRPGDPRTVLPQRGGGNARRPGQLLQRQVPD